MDEWINRIRRLSPQNTMDGWMDKYCFLEWMDAGGMKMECLMHG